MDESEIFRTVIDCQVIDQKIILTNFGVFEYLESIATEVGFFIYNEVVEICKERAIYNTYRCAQQHCNSI